VGTSEVEVVDDTDAVVVREEVLGDVAVETLDKVVDLVVAIVDVVVTVDVEFRM